MSIERIDTTTRIVLIEFDVQTGRILIVSTKNRIDQLRLFIFIFFFFLLFGKINVSIMYY